MLTLQSTVRLNNGVEMPVLGLGTFKSRDGDEVYRAVRWALEIGYRHIDTAKIYHNEEGVGRAVRDSGIPREEIFITTKLWTEDMRNQNEQKAIEDSLRRLKMDYVDLYLIHWPVPGRYVAGFEAMEKIYADGKARAIGVSNYHIHHLEALLASCGVVPAVNQVECHPMLTQVELADYCLKKGIVFEPWSPLGRGGELLSHPVLTNIAEAYGKTPAQVVLRWGLQRGFVNIPKSVHLERIRENADIFDFELSDKEMAEIFTLHDGTRVGPDPDNFDF